MSLYQTHFPSDTDNDIKAGTGSLSILSKSLVQKQSNMEITGEDSESESVWKWEVHQHAYVLKGSVGNERVKTQESRAHVNKLASH